MSTNQEIDVDQLRAELDQIKDAMGIRERSPGAIRIWLVFGVLVPVAAGLSQVVYSQRLSQSYHGLIWLGLLGLGGFAIQVLLEPFLPAIIACCSPRSSGRS